MPLMKMPYNMSKTKDMSEMWEKEIDKEIITAGELLDILKDVPKDYFVEIFSLYDGDYYAGGRIDNILIGGKSLYLYCNKG